MGGPAGFIQGFVLRFILDGRDSVNTGRRGGWSLANKRGVVRMVSVSPAIGEGGGGQREKDASMMTVKEQIGHYMSILRPAIQYLGPVLYWKVEAAMEMACEAHRGQLRRSGEPYISHPVAVALVLAGLGMDCDTIVAGLLHDTVEDTYVTFEDIEIQFGTSVRRIVEGETKVSKLPKMASPMSGSKADEQAENLRWMFVAMIEDWRIIVVKVADRLHNMRTLQYMDREKQMTISRETLEIFAPLAHRLGLWNIKSELENLAFMWLYPDEYREIEEMVRVRLPTYSRVLDESRALLEKVLSEDEVLRRNVERVEVTSRTKELYSLWTKMNQGNKSIHQIFDLAALRVNLQPKNVLSYHQVLSGSSWANDPLSPVESEVSRAEYQRNLEESLCYYVLGVVHELWHPYPQRVKDYIAFPKENGYRSLHTTVMAGRTPLEVQIRTTEMHRVAEYGKAAHCVKNLEDTSWLNSLRECKEEISSSREFVEVVRREILGRRVFVFVGDADHGTTRILNLPKGSTVIDAAFHGESNVSESMVAAKVNGTILPLSYELQNGDAVSFVVSKYSPGPQREWLEHAKMRRTKTQLKLYFRRQKRLLRSAKGWQILRDYLKVHYKGNVTQRSDIPLSTLNDIGFSSVDNFCMILAASGGQEQARLLAKLLGQLRTSESRVSEMSSANVQPSKIAVSKELTVYIDVEKRSSMHGVAASCCLPVAGDPIFGHRPTPNLVPQIHRVSCECATGIRNDEAGTTFPLFWDEKDHTTLYKTWIRVTCEDRNGLLSSVTAAITTLPIMGTRSETVGTTAVLEYCFHVTHTDALIPVIEAVSKVPGVLFLKRQGSAELETGLEPELASPSG